MCYIQISITEKLFIVIKLLDAIAITKKSVNLSQFLVNSNPQSKNGFKKYATKRETFFMAWKKAVTNKKIIWVDPFNEATVLTTKYERLM